MGIFNFVKEAGERVFGGGDDATPEHAPVRTIDMAKADKAKGEALTRMVRSTGMEIEGLEIRFRDAVARIGGSAASQTDREKLILLVGNTHGVARVDDRMKVVKPEPEARMHTVVSGDTLSKIAQQFYGNAVMYMKIFEANKPMLKDPNKIYPGQVLRIPPID